MGPYTPLRLPLLLLVTVFMYGCAQTQHQEEKKRLVSRGYFPISPVKVQLQSRSSLPTDVITQERLLAALPNENIRIAVGEYDENGQRRYGQYSMGKAEREYVIIADHIKYTTKPMRVNLSAFGSVSLTRKATIPLFIGVGVRLHARFKVMDDDAPISLDTMGILADRGEISGTLSIQTIGVSGRDISALLPMPGAISQEMLQQAMQAVRAVKTRMYEGDRYKIHLVPQLLSYENNTGQDVDISPIMEKLRIVID